jgi:hypothetical protein
VESQARERMAVTFYHGDPPYLLIWPLNSRKGEKYIYSGSKIYCFPLTPDSSAPCPFS